MGNTIARINTSPYTPLLIDSHFLQNKDVPLLPLLRLIFEYQGMPLSRYALLLREVSFRVIDAERLRCLVRLFRLALHKYEAHEQWLRFVILAKNEALS